MPFVPRPANAAKSKAKVVPAPEVKRRQAGGGGATHGGTEQRLRSTPGDRPFVDPETGQVIGSFTEHQGVMRIYDLDGKLAHIHEKGIRTSYDPLDFFLAAASFIGAGKAIAHSLGRAALSSAGTSAARAAIKAIPNAVLQLMRSKAGANLATTAATAPFGGDDDFPVTTD